MVDRPYSVLRSGVVSIAIIVTLVVWVTVLAVLHSLHEQAVASARYTATNLARVFDEHVLRIVRAVDGSIVELRDSLEREGPAFNLDGWVRQNRPLPDILPQIGVVDASGRLLATTAGPIQGTISIADREHFRVHADGRMDHLFISKPVLGRASGKWTIQLTRAYRTEGGAFGGIIVFSLDAFYFSKFYESIDIGSGGIIALVGRDGIVRARAAMTDKTIGQSLHGSRLFEEIKRAAQGIYVADSHVDSVPRLFGYRALADYPLIVNVGLAQSDYLADYYSKRAVLLGLAGFLTLAIGGGAMLSVRQDRRRANAENRAQRAELAFARRSAASRARADAERRFRAVAMTASDAIVSWDRAGNIVFWNGGAEIMFGIAAKAALGSAAAALFVAGDWAALRQGDGAAADGKEPQPGRLVRLTGLSRGREFPIEASLNAWNASGESLSVLVARDVGERLKAEEERKILMARVFHAQKMEAIGTLAGGVAHDFNNFIGAVQGFVWLARKQVADGTPTADYLDKAAGAGKRATQVVQQLLTYGRNQPEEAEDLDFGLVVAEAAELGRVSLPSSIGFTIALPAAPLPIHGEAARLQQAILNLVINASQAIGDAPGRIDLAVADVEVVDGVDPGPGDYAVQAGAGELPPGHYARLTVTDSGGGMDQETIDRIFDPFFTTKPVGIGTGLGLAAVENAIAAHGGAVRVCSTKGKGTRFDLYVPRHDVGTTVSAAEPATPAAPRGTARVLVVDDEPDMRTVLADLLRGLGYRVVVAADGQEAVDLFESDPSSFDAVVTDLVMPVLTGDRVAAAVKQIRPDIVVVLCTGRADKATSSSAAHIDATVAKAAAMTELPRALCNVLKQAAVT